MTLTAHSRSHPLKITGQASTILTAAAFCFSAGLALAAGGDDEAAPTQARVPVVTVAVARPQEIVVQVPVSGTLLPRREILIYPQVSGYVIDEILVDIGDVVAASDVLARINARTLTAQLAQARAESSRAAAGVRQANSQIASAEASQEQAEAALTRAQSLARSGNVSGASLDNAVAAAATARATTASAIDGLAVAQAAVLQAESQFEIAQMNLDHATILAPVAGLISARNGQLGAITSIGGDPLFRLIQDGLIEVEAEVIETALGQISVGDPAELDVAGTGLIESEVRLISPTVDAASRLGTIRIATKNRTDLRAGTFAGGVVITDRHTGLAVPASAIQIEDGQSFVLKVDDGVLHRQTVVGGLIWNGWREVLDGLSEGDQVVARAGSFFTDGDRVEPLLPDVDLDAGADK